MFLLRLINYKFHKILTTIMKMLFVFSNQRDARNRICSNFQNKLTSIYASMMINLQSRILHLNQFYCTEWLSVQIQWWWLLRKKNMQLKPNFTLQWIRHLHGSSFHRNVRHSLSLSVPNDFVLFAMHFFFFTSFFPFFVYTDFSPLFLSHS